MKRRDITELHAKTTDELKKMLSDARKSLMDVRFDHEQRKLANTTSLKNSRHDIARILSVLRGKELSDAKNI